MQLKRIFLLLLLFPLIAKSAPVNRKINWKINNLNFDGANYTNESKLPLYFEKVKLNSPQLSSFNILNEVFEPLTDKEVQLVKSNSINTEIAITSKLAFEKKEPYALVSFVPIRKNKVSGKLEKLISFSLNSSSNNEYKTSGYQKIQRTYTSSSVLSTGNWYKIGVVASGVYKLSYDFLKSIGMNVESINPANIRIYGNGGGMLSYLNAIPRKDDLTENAIYVKEDSVNGKLDSNEYILFYGQNPNKWSYNSSDKHFHHQVNLYSDTTYYFITADLGAGKRISSQASSSQTETNTVTTFDDYAYHEKDLTNVLKSGREWYGEYFDLANSYSITFNFPNIESSPVYVKTDLVARNSTNSTFNINYGPSQVSLNVPPVEQGDFSGSDVADAMDTISFTSSSSAINITLTKMTSDAVGYLNYVEVNARRALSVPYTEQLLFRDIKSVGVGNISSFNLTSGSFLQIWEVTDPFNVKIQQLASSTPDYKFILPTDSLREFVAFSDSYLTPKSFGQVMNQNLHGLNQADLIIVSHPAFINQANALAEYHHTRDNFSAVVVTTNQIYNEFSSGAQDISAIRDFVKMLYDRASTPDQQPKYLVLFGDGSYDNKHRFSDNTNFVPTYQSANSNESEASYVTDDFYGLLDDNEGSVDDPELVDIGVGRIPSKSAAEAQAVLNKIINYTSKNEGDPLNANTTFGDWRNVICFVSDDQDQTDGNTFVSQADGEANYVDSNYSNYNIDKIYSDAYVEQFVPGGQRYPDVEAAINERVQRGALIMNYTGHGGEVGWAHEEILGVSDINSWTNMNHLPLFVTATCEFSRFDDPERTSAGEYVLLNPNGGGIALLTTVRLVFGNQNKILNDTFYTKAFVKINGQMPTLGQLYELAKTNSAQTDNNRKFVLLGDPAISLAYPKYGIATTTVNGVNVSGAGTDTIRALDLVNVAGYVTDESGNKLTSYNGVLFPSVYDKEVQTTTLANDGSDVKFPFTIRKNILYKGKVSITNGDFKFSFVVPSGISKNYGIGKISYYAEDGTVDASGNNENVIIGGISSNPPTDKVGPSVNLYMNDNKFVFGGITNENPQLYAVVRDSSGINRSGIDIGHDITAMLDEDSKAEINLNDYYEADLNSYKSGTVRYPFSMLSEGKHSLNFKIWDVYNNSSQAYTEFVVAKSAELALSHVLNYPNPFSNNTKFFFEHNQPGEELDVQIQVYTVSGKLIKTISAFVQTQGFRAEPIDWDGRDDFGDKIGRGVYIYRVKVRSSSGSTADKFEKLVILN